jgi:hypothetical protein
LIDPNGTTTLKTEQALLEDRRTRAHESDRQGEAERSIPRPPVDSQAEKACTNAALCVPISTAAQSSAQRRGELLLCHGGYRYGREARMAGHPAGKVGIVPYVLMRAGWRTTTAGARDRANINPSPLPRPRFTSALVSSSCVYASLKSNSCS